MNVFWFGFFSKKARKWMFFGLAFFLKKPSKKARKWMFLARLFSKKPLDEPRQVKGFFAVNGRVRGALHDGVGLADVAQVPFIL